MMMKMTPIISKSLQVSIIILLLMTIAMFHRVTSINFFPPSFSAAPNFPKNKLYDTTKYLSLENVQGRAGCLADIDQDKYTDLIVIGCNNQCLKLFLWVHSEWKFKEYVDGMISTPNGPDNYTIINDVTAADFNFDGRVDLLVTVTTYNTHTRKRFPGHQLLLYTGLKGSKFSQYPEIVSVVDQVLVMDTNGDMRVDLFGESLLNNRSRTYWINQAPKKGEDYVMYQEVVQESDDGLPLYPLVYPSANVFIDIDGDCSADLFVVSCEDEGYSQSSEELCENQLFEIWLNKDGKLKREGRVIRAPRGSGRVIFNDFDRDGDYDLIVPTCYPQPYCDEINELVIYLNDQPSRKVTDLCARTDFELKRTFNVTFPADKRLAQSTKQNGIYFPATIRAGDYNLDGYTDLVLPIIETTEVIAEDMNQVKRVQTLKMMLWKNIACPKGSSSDCVRTFSEQTDGVDQLPSIVLEHGYNPIFNGFFMDLDETGVLDILTTLYDPISGNQTIRGFYNNFFNDAYFLKTVALNGANERGSQMPGITFKFTVSDLQGVKHPRINTQMTQSSYSSLQTPYHLFGLGRTNGYIEEFFFGKPHDSTSTNYLYQTGIIPNSQLVAMLYPANNPSKWGLELYVNPSGHSFWVAIAVLSTLIMIGLPIIGLWRYEKWVDNKAKTKSQMSHAPSTSVLIG